MLEQMLLCDELAMSFCLVNVKILKNLTLGMFPDRWLFLV